MTLNELKHGLEILGKYLIDKEIECDIDNSCIIFGQDNGDMPKELRNELFKMGYFFDFECGWCHFCNFF